MEKLFSENTFLKKVSATTQMPSESSIFIETLLIEYKNERTP